MKVFQLLVSMVMIVGCADNGNETSSQPDAPNQSTLLDAQMDAHESAGDVEESMQLMKEAREQEMRKQGG